MYQIEPDHLLPVIQEYLCVNLLHTKISSCLPRMIALFELCYKHPWFSMMVDGGSISYFEGKVGLRQGDPASHYLFILILELRRLTQSNHKKWGSSISPEMQKYEHYPPWLCWWPTPFLQRRTSINDVYCSINALLARLF